MQVDTYEMELEAGGWNSTEVAFVLLTHQSRGSNLGIGTHDFLTIEV